MTITDAVTTGLGDRWREGPRPQTTDEWLARAQEVADILAVDAVERDRANQTPHAEVQLLKDSGLVTLLVAALGVAEPSAPSACPR